MQKVKQVLTKGNHKLSKNIYSWSLPASIEVCGRACDGCYAIKAQNRFNIVLKSRENKLLLSKHSDFEEIMLKEIQKCSPKFVRIHDSGEFYSQEYLNKWVYIAEQVSDVIFYGYTKRFNDFNFSALTKLKNVIIINSLQSGSINYGDLDSKPDDMFLCPDYKTSEIRKQKPRGSICGIACTYCMTKPAQETGVYFVKH